MDKLLLRPAEAAEMVGVGRSTIYELLSRGEIQGIRIGHSVRVPIEALRRWVEAQAVGRQK